MRDYPVHHFHSREPLVMLGSLRCRGLSRVYTHRGGGIEYSPRQRLRHELAGVMVRNGFDAFSGNTAHGASSAAPRLRLPSDRFRVTYNGLDFDLLQPSRPAAELRDELGLTAEHFVIGTAANLKKWKRIDRLIAAGHAMGDPSVRVLVMGDGPERAHLEALVHELGFEEQVIFAGSRVDMGNYLQVMDAFCLPSNSNESFGNAAVEAMAMGLPTVVFDDSPGLVEHIDHGVTGFVVGDDQELTSVLGMLAADADVRRRVGHAGAAAV